MTRARTTAGNRDHRTTAKGRPPAGRIAGDRLVLAPDVERCPAVYLDAARPKLAAVESARIARQPIPSTDWRCIRPVHADHPAAPTEHLATPLGITGPSFRFSAELVQPAPDPEPGPGPEPHPDGDDEYPGTPYGLTGDERVLSLVDQLARRGGGVVRADPGDTLVLVVPDGDQLITRPDGSRVELTSALLADVAAALPTVSVLVLAGVAGAVVVPAPTTARG